MMSTLNCTRYRAKNNTPSRTRSWGISARQRIVVIVIVVIDP